MSDSGISKSDSSGVQYTIWVTLTPSGEETLPEKRNSLKVITSITTILHDHAIVVDVQNGEFWELEWINMDRRTRIIASTSNLPEATRRTLPERLGMLQYNCSKTFKGRTPPGSSVTHTKGVLARNTSTAESDWWRGENRDGYATVNGRYFPKDILTTRQEAHVSRYKIPTARRLL
ncbi:hypothetical protein Ac2012v2_007339 [Leucoagaricus gongylophorus]